MIVPSIVVKVLINWPETLESWNVILRAAEIRNHKAVLNVAKEIDSSTVQDITYHRLCHSIFILKKRYKLKFQLIFQRKGKKNELFQV